MSRQQGEDKASENLQEGTRSSNKIRRSREGRIWLPREGTKYCGSEILSEAGAASWATPGSSSPTRKLFKTPKRRLEPPGMSKKMRVRRVGGKAKKVIMTGELPCPREWAHHLRESPSSHSRCSLNGNVFLGSDSRRSGKVFKEPPRR